MADNVLPFRPNSERLAEAVCQELGKSYQGQVQIVMQAIDAALDAAGGQLATEAAVDGVYQYLRKVGLTDADWNALCDNVSARGIF